MSKTQPAQATSTAGAGTAGAEVEPSVGVHIRSEEDPGWTYCGKPAPRDEPNVVDGCGPVDSCMDCVSASLRAMGVDPSKVAVNMAGRLYERSGDPDMEPEVAEGLRRLADSLASR